MKVAFLYTVLALTCYTALAQRCSCPAKALMGKGEKTERVFSLGKKQLGICGYKEINGKDTIYSEFSLFECGMDSTVAEWGAVQNCKISKKGDTIIVNELLVLPLGKDFSYVTKPFYITKFFYNNNKLVRGHSYNTTLPKFTNTQIKEAITKSKQLPRENTEDVIHGADMLLWAFISGSNEAGTLLKNYQAVHGPFDGHMAEEWNEIWNIYLDYEHPEKPGKIR